MSPLVLPIHPTPESRIRVNFTQCDTDPPFSKASSQVVGVINMTTRQRITTRHSLCLSEDPVPLIQCVQPLDRTNNLLYRACITHTLPRSLVSGGNRSSARGFEYRHSQSPRLYYMRYTITRVCNYRMIESRGNMSDHGQQPRSLDPGSPDTWRTFSLDH